MLASPKRPWNRVRFHSWWELWPFPYFVRSQTKHVGALSAKGKRQLGGRVGGWVGGWVGVSFPPPLVWHL